jgi:hypothetical protein
LRDWAACGYTARFVSQGWRQQVAYNNRKQKSHRVDGPLSVFVLKVKVSLSKRRFCQQGRHPKMRKTNTGGILLHSAHARKQKLYKSYVLSYVLKITTN